MRCCVTRAAAVTGRQSLGLLFVLVVLAVSPAMAPADSGCPNGEIRDQQSSTYLPQCRAYEQVSPVDKNGSSVQQFLRLAADGEGVAWISLGAYADTPGANAEVAYAAHEPGRLRQRRPSLRAMAPGRGRTCSAPLAPTPFPPISLR